VRQRQAGPGAGGERAPVGPGPRRFPPLVELTRARLLEFFREPGALFWVFVFPVLMGLTLGFAFREKPPEKAPVGVLGGPQASEIASALASGGRVKPRVFASEDEARLALRTGKISLLVEPGPPLTYRFDPTRPEARTARLESDAAIQKAHGQEEPVAVRDEIVREKGSRYIDFLLPGLIGLNLMGTGMWGIGYAILTARIRKTLKLFTATPMKRRDFLASQILARLVFLFFEVPVILLFGILVFGVPVRGSLGSLAALCVLGAIAFSGIGLLTTSRAQTLETGNGLMNLVMIPMWLVSGSFFSSERFPEVLQPAIQALPLTALNNALRAVMLDGRSLVSVGGELLLLAAWTVIAFVAALKIFRWQ
jgi:ABC-2 type transport system permease protein